MVAVKNLTPLNGDDSEEYGEDCILPVAALRIDHTYQRPPSPSRIKKMAMEWDPNIVGRLQVNVRVDGSMYVWDGQHRKGAHELLGITQAHCTVFYGWDVQKEAREYVKANRGQKKSSRYEEHVGSLAEGDFRATTIEHVVREFHFQTSATRSNTNHGKSRSSQDFILAIATLYQIYDRKTCGGAEGLRQVLRILTNAYPGRVQEHMVDSDMLDGLHVFLTRVHKDPNFREKVLIAHLSNESATVLLNKAQGVMARSRRSRVDIAIPLLLWELYNYGLHRDRRLAPLPSRAQGEE